jgi:GT2 family glycosyltransferase
VTPDVLPTCAVLVLNWNGIAHLRYLLPSLDAAVARLGRPVPIVVVDNRSTQSDVSWIRSTHPAVEVVVARRNDYLFSLNEAVDARSEDVVVILNNDMRVDPNCLEPLLRHFADETVFGATANVYDWEGTRHTTGQRRVRHEHGWLYQWWIREVDHPTYTLEAGGGCAAFRRAFFSQLGGFDRLYHPAYFEDVDLSYRAWQQGWRTVYEPRSVMYHRIGATLTTPGRESRTNRLLARNHGLCVVKNVGGWGTALMNIALLPVRTAKAVIRGDRDGAIGLLMALSRVPTALVSRARRPRPRWRGIEIDAGVSADVSAREPVWPDTPTAAAV